MHELKKILQLVGGEQGKVFILDQTGEVAAVVMSLDEYSKLRSGFEIKQLVKRVDDLSEQAEQLNQKITAAQMEEEEEAIPEFPASEPKDPETYYVEPL